MTPMLDRIPKPLKNFYLVCFVLFSIWMLIFDENDLLTQFCKSSMNKKLTEDKAHFDKEISKVISDRDELRSDTVQLEKFAREKYHMKKEGEDVYKIVPEADDAI